MNKLNLFLDLLAEFKLDNKLKSKLFSYFIGQYTKTNVLSDDDFVLDFIQQEKQYILDFMNNLKQDERNNILAALSLFNTYIQKNKNTVSNQLGVLNSSRHFTFFDVKDSKGYKSIQKNYFKLNNKKLKNKKIIIVKSIKSHKYISDEICSLLLLLLVIQHEKLKQVKKYSKEYNKIKERIRKTKQQIRPFGFIK